MSVTIRPARADDLEDALRVYACARRYMQQNGNPTQWGESYPSRALVQADIRAGHLYVGEDAQGEVRCAFAFISGEDPAYADIEDGAWLNDAPYCTLHRVASDGVERGTFAACMDFCRARCGNLRIDTHADNHTMQHLIRKHGFCYCGVVHMEDGSPRLAFQWLAAPQADLSDGERALSAALIAHTTEKMIELQNGNLHDIHHFLKVHAYARVIGTLEGLDARTQKTLELAAIVHDIACPLCREKYGRADGPLQEKEGPALARELLDGLGCDPETAARVCHLVGRHHTYAGVDGLDHQILLEADFLVNADEGAKSTEAIRAALQGWFRTPSGIRLLKSVYRLS